MLTDSIASGNAGFEPHDNAPKEDKAGEIGDKRLFRCLDFCKLGNQYLLRQTVKHLSNHTFEPLKGVRLQQAEERRAARRRGMEAQLQKIRRQPVQEEKFIDDYLSGGDFHEI